MSADLHRVCLPESAQAFRSLFSKFSSFVAMALERMTIHPRGLNRKMQVRFCELRKSTTPPLTWKQIAPKVRNREGKIPYWKVCRDVYRSMQRRRYTHKDAYSKCGRKLTVTKEIQRWLIRRLLSLRCSQEVRSRDLQLDLARKKGMHFEASTVRKPQD